MQITIDEKYPTNGDVIKAVFPKSKNIKELALDICIDVDGLTYFTKKWWYAPYEGGIGNADCD